MSDKTFVLPTLDIFACQEMQKCLLSMPGEFNVVMPFLELQCHLYFLYVCLKYIGCLVEKCNFSVFFLSANILEATYMYRLRAFTNMPDGLKPIFTRQCLCLFPSVPLDMFL